MWRNLAPNLLRQRLIIEGLTKNIIKPREIKDYLTKLAQASQMEIMSGPLAYSAQEKGYGGWIHWKSSGAHFYSYPTKPPLFTVDAYTCRPFSVHKIVEFTRNYFKAQKIVWREIRV
jgi:S-adenosylmethionine decarboxylase